jgi:hypothetical protein
MAAGEQGQGGFQTGTEVALNTGWQGATGRGVTVVTYQAVELILHHVGANDRQFRDLMAQGFRVMALEGMATTATGVRQAGDKGVDLLRRDQQTLVTGMTGLAASFLAGLVGCSGRPTFAVKAIRGRGQGGVGGVGAQLVSGVGQLLLQLLDLSTEFLNLGTELAVGVLQFGDPLLCVGLFQGDEASA